MPKSSFETWEPIHMPHHRDPYEEFIKDAKTFTTMEAGQRVPIEVKNECVFGCGHCGIVFKTREDLEKVQCQ